MKSKSESKKAPKNFLIGLSISLAITLAAFEYQSPVMGVKSLGAMEFEDDMFFEYVPVRKVEKPKTLPDPKQKIEIVDPFKPFEIKNNNEQITSELQPDLSELDDLLTDESEGLSNEPEIFIPLKTRLPHFPGGDSALYSFIGKNLRFPSDFPRTGSSSAVVYVSFTIGETGEVNDVRVLNDVHYSLAREAKRVIEMLPKWSPAYQGYRPVAIEHKMPIRFTLRP